MFFDSVGNLYIIDNELTYQVNISSDEMLTYDQVDVEKKADVKCNIIMTSDQYSYMSLRDVIDIDIHDDNNESQFYDYMTIGDTVINDMDEDEHFDFFTDINLPVYVTEEDICSLYETFIIQNDIVLFRSRSSHLPHYRLFIDFSTKTTLLKAIGSPPKRINNMPSSIYDKPLQAL